MTEYKTIQVTKATHDKLASLGKKGDTYEAIIARLLDQVKKRK